MKVAIDFDNTITQGGQFPAIGNLRDGCKEAIDEIRKNHQVIIWTCRSGDSLDKAIKFLDDNEIGYDSINENIPPSNTTRKIWADIYIDDKNIFTEEIDWVKIRDYFSEERCDYSSFEERLRNLRR